MYNTGRALSALAVLLLLTFYTPSAIAQYAKITCPDRSRIPNCECDDTEFYCPTMNSTFRVDISTGRDAVKVTCYEDLGELPNLHIGNIKKLFVIDCKPLADKPLLETLGFLGVNSTQLLHYKYRKSKFPYTAVLFEGLQDLTNLTLVNGIERLDLDTFSNLPNLRRLDIMDNELSLQRGIFDSLAELSHLMMDRNQISQLEPGMFGNLRKLQKLDLKANKLSELSKSTFQGLENLDYLDLSANEIESLSADTFAQLPNLNELSLSFNRISSIRGNLTENRKLKTFKLAFNKVPLTLSGHLLSHLPELEEVDLQNSELQELPENLFRESRAITRLDLSSNMLESLPETLLHDQRNLEHLSLDHNRLEALPDQFFKATRKLTDLQVSNNRVQNLSGNIFATLGKLKVLHLENNNIHRIDDSTFEETTSLEQLYLQNNRLSFHSTSFVHSELDMAESDHTPFQYLENLRELNLRNNSITTIFQDWQVNNLKLEKLDLSYNAITKLSSPTDLNFFSSGITVDLSHNRISYIFAVNMGQDMSRVKVRLTGNPLNCDCKMLPFVRYVRAEDKLHIQFDTDDLHCSEPLELIGSITVLNTLDLTCPLTGEDTGCPSKCNCIERPADRTIVVNCTERGLTEIRSLPVPSSKNYNFTELHIENNFFEELPTWNVTGYEAVVELYARNNSIGKVAVNNLPQNLRSVDLRQNKLTTMHETVLGFLNNSAYLRGVQLSSNRWTCDCSNKDFMLFVQENHRKLSTDISLITCEDGQRVDSLTVNKLCDKNSILYIAICLILASTGLILGAISAIYYSYQIEIKVWLFKHKLLLWFVTEEELDKDKQYDAFISYSHEDALFVECELVPRMENLMNFKTCVHERDWIPGETIPEQIISSVENSRRTVIVLSKHYLNSTWAQMEFQVAHLKSLAEKRIRVVIIMFGDIGDVDSLDSELKAYLKMNTYVKHEDPWFWDKLEYAMPHPVTVTELKKQKKKRSDKETAIMLEKIEEKIKVKEPMPVSV